MDKQDGQDTEGFDAFILSILPLHANKRAIKDLTPILTGCIGAKLQTQFGKP